MKFLEEFTKLFNRYAHSDAGDGCETCGYGASKLMSEEDYEALLRDIDRWIVEQRHAKAFRSLKQGD